MLDAPHIAVHQAGIVAVGAGLTLAQGVFKGNVVDANGNVIGFLAWPDAGGVAIRGPGVSYDWITGQLDANADGFITGDDQDLWMVWWTMGWPLADWNMDGWVTGDDFDAHAQAWAGGTP